MVEFTVLGRPQPAGSKRAFAVRKAGEPTGRIAVVDDSRRTKPWQQLVRSVAADALRGLGPLEGSLMLEVDFYLARPAAHFGTGRNRSTLRPSAPAFPAVRPDVTKLMRGLEDALTGLVWRDDAQIVDQWGRKRYGWPERTEVTVWARVDGP